VSASRCWKRRNPLAPLCGFQDDITGMCVGYLFEIEM
jgi:hypothetical protein